MADFSPHILGTRGAGFIGSALIWALNRRGLTDFVVTDFLGQDEKWRNPIDHYLKKRLERQFGAGKSRLAELQRLVPGRNGEAETRRKRLKQSQSCHDKARAVTALGQDVLKLTLRMGCRGANRPASMRTDHNNPSPGHLNQEVTGRSRGFARNLTERLPRRWRSKLET